MNPTLEKILNNVSKTPIVDAGDIDAVSDLILDALTSGLKIQRAGIWLFDTEADGIRCHLLIDKRDGTRAEKILLQRKDFPHYFSALDRDRAIVAHNAHTHCDTSEFSDSYLTPLDINAMLDVPIRHSGKMVGVICCENTCADRQWHDDDVVFASIMADLFGRAISASERNNYAEQLIETNHNLEQKIKSRTMHLEETIVLLKRLQSKLIESEKLASLGALVAGVAHEVNTPLGVAITANSHLHSKLHELIKNFERDNISEEDFSTYLNNANNTHQLIHENLERAATLIQNFKKTAADQQQLEAETLVLKDYIEQLLVTLHPVIKKHQVIVSVTGPDLPMTTYVGAIAQIITNFVTNSCSHGFSSEPDNHKRQNKIFISIKKSRGAFWELDYRDNGCGMAPEKAQKIYEPFFTTARSSGGTGLGMSIVYNLIQQKLSGTIELETEPGKGIHFNIVFPELS